ncbi:uncharacterized protein LOC143509550 [Brachyhypopomus gauderio]|uniref:uncharacterized protein LOC143509550 n=1 Tax=Brachyhypopomus gauderio TaxID=698409 RepID=UPI004042E4D0
MGHVRLCALLTHVLLCSGLNMNLPAPVNLTIRSWHFVHLLSWEAGPGSPEETCFTVFVRSLKEDWRPVNTCTLLRSPLSCNLTEEFSDPVETYYTKVYGYLGNQTSEPALGPAFLPFQDTTPQPPVLKVSQCNQSLCVRLQAPSPRLFAVYNSPLYGFRYKLHFNEFWRTTEGLKDVVLEHLPPDQEYCVSVTIEGHNATSRPVCTFMTVAVHNSDAAVVVCLTLLVLLCGMVFLLLWISGFLCLKTSLPSVLGSFQKKSTVYLLPWTPVSFPSISVEPRADEEVDEDVAKRIEGEEEDSGVIYEGWHGKTLGVEKSSQSFNPFASPQWIKTPCTSVVHVIETQTSHVHVGEPSWSTEVALTQPCQTKATSQALDPVLLLPESDVQEIRQEHQKPFRHGHEPSVGAEVKDVVNVNLSSLVLGGCWGEQQITEHRRTGQLGDTEHVDRGVLSPVNRTSNTAQNGQSTTSVLSRIITTDAEDEEEEEEEEDFSGYLLRN